MAFNVKSHGKHVTTIGTFDIVDLLSEVIFVISKNIGGTFEYQSTIQLHFMHARSAIHNCNISGWRKSWWWRWCLAQFPFLNNASNKQHLLSCSDICFVMCVLFSSSIHMFIQPKFRILKHTYNYNVESLQSVTQAIASISDSASSNIISLPWTCCWKKDKLWFGLHISNSLHCSQSLKPGSSVRFIMVLTKSIFLHPSL